MKKLRPGVKAHRVKRARQGQNAWQTPRSRIDDAARTRSLNAQLLTERRSLGFRFAGVAPRGLPLGGLSFANAMPFLR